jgi:hypothetical protein
MQLSAARIGFFPGGAWRDGFLPRFFVGFCGVWEG